jgi:NADP-dependent 3-hydroxy acid dehydrogenase YdfG
MANKLALITGASSGIGFALHARQDGSADEKETA